jgi:hypothetical protein
MRINWLDGVATVLVAAAISVFGFWLAGAEPFGLSSVRAVAVVVLVLGAAACTAARPRFDAVYGIDGATRAPLAYITVVTLAGAVTTVAAVTALVTGAAAALWILVTGVGALWVLATTRHLLSGAGRLPTGSTR